jgi:glutaredoxin-like YruB-family protein
LISTPENSAPSSFFAKHSVKLTDNPFRVGKSLSFSNQTGFRVTRFQNDSGKEFDSKQTLPMRRKNMKVSRFFLVFLALVLVSATSSAEIFKWVDENGVVHFSDAPTESISETGEKEDVSAPDPNPEDNSPPAAEPRAIILDPNFFDPLDESEEDPVAVKAPSVEIYETSWCGYCKKAKNFFRSRGIKFKTYDIEKDQNAARRMMTLTRRRAVPFVVINGQPIQGYSVQAYEHALRN